MFITVHQVDCIPNRTIGFIVGGSDFTCGTPTASTSIRNWNYLTSFVTSVIYSLPDDMVGSNMGVVLLTPEVAIRVGQYEKSAQVASAVITLPHHGSDGNVSAAIDIANNNMFISRNIEKVNSTSKDIALLLIDRDSLGHIESILSSAGRLRESGVALVWIVRGTCKSEDTLKARLSSYGDEFFVVPEYTTLRFLVEDVGRLLGSRIVSSNQTESPCNCLEVSSISSLTPNIGGSSKY